MPIFAGDGSLRGRLAFPSRTVLAALVLLLPMGFVTGGYVDIQRGQVAFSAKERDGIAYLRPVLELLARTVEERQAAVTDATRSKAAVLAAIREVNTTDWRYGAALGLTGTWSTARSALRAAQAADAGREAFDAYTKASSALLVLIVQVSDTSNLTLDPDLDSYYLMDALVFRLPFLLDLSGQAGDEARLSSDRRVAQTDQTRLSLARTAGALSSAQTALDSGLATALSNTARAELRAASSKVASEHDGMQAMLTQVDKAVRTGVLGVITPAAADRTGTAVTRLIATLGPELDALLAIRIHNWQIKAYKVEAAAAVAVLMVGFMLLGVYRAAAERRRAQTHASLLRQAASTANAVDTFAEAADRLLQVVCEEYGWLAGRAWTTLSEPVAWFVGEHRHRHGGPCFLSTLAVRGVPSVDGQPFDPRTRIGSGAALLSSLGDSTNECGIGSAVSVPVLAGGEAAGTLAFYLPAGATSPAPDLIANLEQIGLALGRVVERQRTAATLIDQATHDPVTGLANRWRLLDEISATQQEIAGQRGRRRSSAILLINLDRFRLINDSLGYAAGDHLLREAADRLSRGVEPGDLVARLGADEFVVLAHREAQTADSVAPFTALAHRLIEQLRDTVNVLGHQVPLRASVGVCPLSEAHSTSADYPAGVLRDADAALRHAKRRGKNQIQVFDAALRSTAAARIADEAALAAAIVNGELLLHYQPIISLRTGLPVGAEALVRWLRPGHGLVQPDNFIPLAEDSGMIVDLGRWVLRQSCHDAVAWWQTVPLLAAATVSVNVSTRQLTHPRFLTDLDDALRDFALPPSRLVLEITETALIEDTDAVMATLRAIRARDIHLALDDFGTGYSSMSYVQHLPVTILKIDKSFVDPITGPSDGITLSEVVLKLAEATGLRTIAEGVETAAQAEVLSRLGCDSAQGYLWSRPVPLDELADTAATLAAAAGAVTGIGAQGR